MKIKLHYSCLFLAFTVSVFAQQVKKIGTNQNTINPSAVLELESNTKGLLLPRMTLAQRSAISPAAPGLMVWCTDCIPNGMLYYYNGTGWISFNVDAYPNLAICDGTVQTAVVPITSASGKIWMDRNLGASRAATSFRDYMAYGCLYQWGRGNDGHASINWTSATSGTPVNNTYVTGAATTNTPGHASFIKNAVTPFDWRSGDEPPTRWQTAGNTNNNPCPTNYRVPTNAELQAELERYLIVNSYSYANGGFKFVAAGYRDANGIMYSTVSGTQGFYYTSTPIAGNSSVVTITTGMAAIIYANYRRTYAMSVRCVKN
jgi:uncharacterized protein (TIGR02145 family)